MIRKDQEKIQRIKDKFEAKTEEKRQQAFLYTALELSKEHIRQLLGFSYTKYFDWKAYEHDFIKYYAKFSSDQILDIIFRTPKDEIGNPRFFEDLVRKDYDEDDDESDVMTKDEIDNMLDDYEE